jgi:ADP-heptose:LPS heptosyltransferase
VENYAALADRIAEHFQVKVFAVGTKSEKAQIEKLAALSQSEIVDLCGRTDIPVLAGILGGAKLVISNDTGPGHVAVAMGTPTVIIFGPTNPLRIRPYKRPHTIVAVDAEDRGRAIESTDVRHRIEEVTVESVFAEVECHLRDAERS